MHKIQTDMNLTTNILGKHIRSAIGSRNVIECNLKDRLREKNHRLDEHFNIETLSFLISYGNHKDNKNQTASEDVVLCHSVENLIDFVASERDYDSAFRSTIGIDSGGEFLKVCLTVQSCADDEKKENRPRMSSDFQDSGVKNCSYLQLLRIFQKITKIF